MRVTGDLLRAIAGWAITRRGDAGPCDAAMRALTDGCEQAVPFADAIAATAEKSPPVSKPVDKDVPPQPLRPKPKKTVPAAEKDMTCQAGYAHRFHIRTQRCIFCDRTYRDVMNREPEFLGK